MIGKTDRANHEYDLTDFWTALNQNNLPAVSFLKAAAYQDGHAGYSDPLDGQTFLVNTINQLQKSPEWKVPQSLSRIMTQMAGMIMLCRRSSASPTAHKTSSAALVLVGPQRPGRMRIAADMVHACHFW